MRGVNKVILIGHVGNDPELKRSSTGTEWCRLSVATNRSRKKGDDWVEVTDWHQVQVYGRRAENCQRFLKRGSKIHVEGHMEYDNWEDREGRKHRSAKVMAQEVLFLDKAATA